ncbi:uncharacterized protein [Notamacropus eugenii]|uniref:uncharacterized protein n=1 Tax=Notamacropus eugenii TaxID=9315 RepID=UPI003B683B34
MARESGSFDEGSLGKAIKRVWLQETEERERSHFAGWEEARGCRPTAASPCLPPSLPPVMARAPSPGTRRLLRAGQAWQPPPLPSTAATFSRSPEPSRGIRNTQSRSWCPHSLKTSPGLRDPSAKESDREAAWCLQGVAEGPRQGGRRPEGRGPGCSSGSLAQDGGGLGCAAGEWRLREEEEEGEEEEGGACERHAATLHKLQSNGGEPAGEGVPGGGEGAGRAGNPRAGIHPGLGEPARHVPGPRLGFSHVNNAGVPIRARRGGGLGEAPLGQEPPSSAAEGGPLSPDRQPRAGLPPPPPGLRPPRESGGRWYCLLGYKVPRPRGAGSVQLAPWPRPGCSRGRRLRMLRMPRMPRMLRMLRMPRMLRMLRTRPPPCRPLPSSLLPSSPASLSILRVPPARAPASRGDGSSAAARPPPPPAPPAARRPPAPRPAAGAPGVVLGVVMAAVDCIQTQCNKCISRRGAAGGVRRLCPSSLLFLELQGCETQSPVPGLHRGCSTQTSEAHRSSQQRQQWNKQEMMEIGGEERR